MLGDDVIRIGDEGYILGGGQNLKGFAKCLADKISWEPH